jgi:hypothetical protein
LRELEDDLTKAFHNNLSSPGSDTVVLPPPNYMNGSVPNKKRKELLDRKKDDWIFKTPEDLTTGPSAEELLKLPDYAREGKTSKMDRFERLFDSLGPKRSKSSNKSETGELERDRKRDDSNFFGIEKYDLSNESDSKEKDAQIKDPVHKEQIFPGVFDAKQIDRAAGGSLVASPNIDVFGLGAVSTSLEQVESHKAYMKQYQALLDGSPLTAHR